MLMIRHECYKYIHCPTDPEQLFDLQTDPDERHNLAHNSTAQPLLDRFRKLAAQHWDPEAVKQEVIADQRRRRLLHSALTIGQYHSWDYQPRSDASNEYTRSHMDLTDFDIYSRFPRPPTFKPKPS